MDANLKDVLSEALKLPEEERRELASELFATLERPFSKDVEEAWEREILKRLEAMESGQVQGIPWSEARRRIFGKADDTAAA